MLSLSFQTFHFRIKKVLLNLFEDFEAVIKMITKGRSPTMRHVSRTFWINFVPKIQIKYIDTKNQLADILTKGNFTRDKWNHLLRFSNASHLRSWCALKDSGEETSHSKLSTNHALYAGTPSHVSSSTSVSPGKRKILEIKIPGVHLLRKRSDQGDLISANTECQLSTTIIMSNGKFFLSKLLKVCVENWFWDVRAAWRSDETSSLTRKPIMMEPRNPLWTRKHLVTDRGDLMSILKEEHDFENSSSETVKQNWNCQ